MNPINPMDDIMFLMEEYTISPYTMLTLVLDHLSVLETVDLIEFLYKEVPQLLTGVYDDY